MFSLAIADVPLIVPDSWTTSSSNEDFVTRDVMCTWDNECPVAADWRRQRLLSATTLISSTSYVLARPGSDWCTGHQ